MTVEADRVDEIFYRARQTSGKERAALLAEACAGEPALRREVESLLESIERVGEDFLDRPIFADRLERRDSAEGRRLGAFRIQRELGRGGMGRVYLAVRDDGEVEQQVAVKVLKWGLDTREVVRRFRRERQILARLDHPNIARFLDASTTDDGLPYFVMEYVEGVPIDRFCEERKLGIRARLELFRKVCAAVRFAHGHLVVHRDLKPGNVLVTADGSPKLLDFSIAKLLQADPSSPAAPAPSLLTADGFHPMTLAYASPEQIRGDEITTASDVYALGILLFLLLTGSRPYRGSDSSPIAFARAVCEDEVARPSVAAGRGGAEALRRRLAGDLDSIVLKALEKDPGHRYESVGQLSEDVRRHLEGLPIEARDATFFYRFGKYLRRHRVEGATVLAVLFLVVGFTVRTTILKNEAVRQSRRADAVTGFMIETFSQADPETSQGRDVTAGELLDTQAKKIRTDLAGEPLTRAALMDAMGSAYFNLGDQDRAEPLLAESLKLRRTLSGVRPEDLVASLTHVAAVDHARSRFGEAEKKIREALEILRGLSDGDPRLELQALNNLAALHKAQDRLAEAETLYRQSLELRVRRLGQEHEDVDLAKNNLAATLKARGKFEESETLYRESLDRRTRRAERTGRGWQEVATSLNNLAGLLKERGDLAEAERLYRRGLALRRQVYAKNPLKIAVALKNLGSLLRLRGKLDEAESLLLAALEIRRKRLGPDHPKAALVLKELQLLERDRGDGGAPADAEDDTGTARR